MTCMKVFSTDVKGVEMFLIANTRSDREAAHSIQVAFEDSISRNALLFHAGIMGTIGFKTEGFSFRWKPAVLRQNKILDFLQADPAPI